MLSCHPSVFPYMAEITILLFLGLRLNENRGQTNNQRRLHPGRVVSFLLDFRIETLRCFLQSLA